MQKCCTLNQSRRPQRRINGLQLPLNYQQVIGWIVFVTTGIINCVVLVEIQFATLKTISLTIFVILYAAHIVSHLTATLLDPSEKELRVLEVNSVPEFDRNIHAHVIENGRCHLCNIYTSSRKTKHCSICNKCVDQFDHHCKWLNSCVGRRNYGAFLSSVVTALLLALMTSSLCIADMIFFLTDFQRLSPLTKDVINCTSVTTNFTVYHEVKFCSKSIMFLLFLIILCTSALAIACALLHLFCFHVYISMLGVSTYEYIVRSGSLTNMPQFIKLCRCCRFNLPGKFYVISKTKRNKNTNVRSKEDGITENSSELNDPKITKLNNSPVKSEKNVASFITILVNNELDRARKIFMYDKNKIHPQEDTS